MLLTSAVAKGPEDELTVQRGEEVGALSGVRCDCGFPLTEWEVRGSISVEGGRVWKC